MKPLIPYHEERRLQVLRAYEILDTLPEVRFDTIVADAAARFNVPIALFTLIDEHRQWFKSRVGLDVRETDRAISFCSYAVAIDMPLVLENTSTYRRFANSPLVVGHPHIAFYAGAPVRSSSGEALGTLCIIDQTARRFPWSDLLRLKQFAGEIELQLEARQVEEGRSSTLNMH